MEQNSYEWIKSPLSSRIAQWIFVILILLLADVVIDKIIYIPHPRLQQPSAIQPIQAGETKSYKAIGSQHVTDGNSVYYTYSSNPTSSDVITGADAPTFRLVKNSQNYAVDKNRAYYNATPIDEADISTLNVLDVSSDYAIDKSHVFYDGDIILGADPTTFKRFPGDSSGIYAEDVHSLFYDGNLIIGANPTNFSFLDANEDYAVDNQNVYYDGIKVKGADAQSFIPVVSNGSSDSNVTIDAKDAYHFYSQGVQVIE